MGVYGLVRMRVGKTEQAATLYPHLNSEGDEGGGDGAGCHPSTPT